MGSRARRIDQSTTIEDLMANPHAYGIPSFEDYQRNPGKWNMGANPEAAMESITAGPQKFRKDLNKIIFKINGKEMPEDHVERALSDFGFTLEDIDLGNRKSLLKKDIQMIPQGGGKYDLVVNFLP